MQEPNRNSGQGQSPSAGMPQARRPVQGQNAQHRRPPQGSGRNGPPAPRYPQTARPPMQGYSGYPGVSPSSYARQENGQVRPPVRRPENTVRQPSVQMPVQCCVPIKKKKKNRIISVVLVSILVLALAAVCVTLGVMFHRRQEEARRLVEAMQTYETDAFIPPRFPPETEPPETEPPGPAAVLSVPDALTVTVGEEIKCGYAIVIDVEAGVTVAERLPDERIYPASMTKVMTLIVAHEQLASFDQTFTFTAELINPLVEANASRAGFMVGETVPVIDLFYGAALPSGGDATAALAQVVAGSEEAFAELMNQKAAEMGLVGTHFVNASGLHEDDHYSTVREIAAILSYAMQIDSLREIFSTYQYTTSSTPQHPEGMIIKSTLFSDLSGDELPGMKIVAGKTGYTLEARRCLCSMAIRDDGRTYIAVVVGGENKWVPITDSVELYARCLPQQETTAEPPQTAVPPAA